MIVISDNSPLQYLVLIGCVDCLPKLYEVVVTTPEVVDELKREATPRMVRDWIERPPSWLTVRSAKENRFADVLDLGEASALSLARELHADLVLIDERLGTDVAQKHGLICTGTLGILIQAGLADLIDFGAALNRLTTETRFYASSRLIEAANQLYQQRRKF